MTSAFVPPALAPVEGAPAVNAGYGASLSDIAAFQDAIGRAAAHPGGAAVTVTPPAAAAPAPALRALMVPLDRINAEAAHLSARANAAATVDGTLSPGAVVRMTMQVHEFMFQCQLTSNAANRTSDGLQQLFRQQA